MFLLKQFRQRNRSWNGMAKFSLIGALNSHPKESPSTAKNTATFSPLPGKERCRGVCYKWSMMVDVYRPFSLQHLQKEVCWCPQERWTNWDAELVGSLLRDNQLLIQIHEGLDQLAFPFVFVLLENTTLSSFKHLRFTEMRCTDHKINPAKYISRQSLVWPESWAINTTIYF